MQQYCMQMESVPPAECLHSIAFIVTLMASAEEIGAETVPNCLR